MGRRRKRRKRTLSNQLNYVVTSSERLGIKKHIDKKNKVSTIPYIYSLNELSRIRGLSTKLSQWVDSKYEVKLAKDIKCEQIQAFVDEMIEQKVWKTPKTIGTMISDLKKISVMINTVYGADTDWTELKKPEKMPERRELPGMTAEHIQLMHDYLYGRDSSAKYTVMLLYSSGLRFEELVDLRFNDIDLDRGTVLVRHGKGNKRRVAQILDTDGNRGYIQYWERAIAECKAQGWINFCGQTSEDKEDKKRCKAKTSKALTRAKQVLGLDEIYPQTSHSIRKAYCYDLYHYLRRTHTDKEAWETVKDSIGHGEAKRLDLKRTYLERAYKKEDTSIDS